MSPLYQLPVSGNWIILADVTSITAWKAHGAGEYRLAPRVVVRTVTNYYEIECETFDAAKTLRDQIAADKNEVT